MLELEEKSPHRLSVLLPKTKHGSFDDMEDTEARQGEAVGEQVKEEFRGNDKTDELAH